MSSALLLVAIVGSGIAASVDGLASAELFQHAVVVGASNATLRRAEAIQIYDRVPGGDKSPTDASPVVVASVNLGEGTAIASLAEDQIDAGPRLGARTPTRSYIQHRKGR